MLVFPGVHFKNHMFTGASTASFGGANPTGWSNERLFVDCNVLSHVKSLERKAQLL